MVVRLAKGTHVPGSQSLVPSTRRGAEGGIRTRNLTITNRLRYHCATSALVVRGTQKKTPGRASIFILAERCRQSRRAEPDWWTTLAPSPPGNVTYPPSSDLDDLPHDRHGDLLRRFGADIKAYGGVDGGESVGVGAFRAQVMEHSVGAAL